MLKFFSIFCFFHPLNIGLNRPFFDRYQSRSAQSDASGRIRCDGQWGWFAAIGQSQRPNSDASRWISIQISPANVGAASRHVFAQDAHIPTQRIGVPSTDAQSIAAQSTGRREAQTSAKDQSSGGHSRSPQCQKGHQPVRESSPLIITRMLDVAKSWTSRWYFLLFCNISDMVHYPKVQGSGPT